MDFLKTIRIYTRLLIFCTTICSLLLGVNLPAIPGPVPAVLLPIDHAFQDLLVYANPPESTNLLLAVDDFENSLFNPLLNIMAPIPDQMPLLARLRAMRNSLDNAHALMGPLVKNLKEMTGKRIDLARIDQNIFNGRGRMGTFIHPWFNAQVQNALYTTTGKIFHITRSLNDAGVIIEEVTGVGSGILINQVAGAGGIPIINNLAAVPLGAAGVQPLNGVLTCAHVLSAEDAEHIEAYFVPSDMLDLIYGLPIAINTAHIPLATQADLINFLRNNPHSFRITHYTTWQRRPPAPLVAFPNNTMNVTRPMYLNNEDIVIANIVPNGANPLRQYNRQATINFLTNTAAVAALVMHLQGYFAIGYPGCDQYDLAPLLNFSPALTADLGISPLYITKASVVQQGPVGVNNGQISHKAPSAPGMSGGPLLTVADNTITIFGVITEGDDNDEVACNLQ